MKNGERVQVRSGKCVRGHKSSPVRTPTSYNVGRVYVTALKSSLADIRTVTVCTYMSAEYAYRQAISLSVKLAELVPLES